MKAKSLITVAVIVFAMLMAIGCAKVPQAELDAAKAAIDAAKQAEADRYVPDLFNAAMDSLNAANAEIETQNGKFALLRSYGRSKELLAAATEAANKAKDAVAEAKEKVRAEAEALLPQVQPAMDEAKKLMKKAPRGKEGRAALQAMQADLDDVAESVETAKVDLENGDYLTAHNKIQAGLDKINSVIEELKEAIAKKTAISRM